MSQVAMPRHGSVYDEKITHVDIQLPKVPDLDFMIA